MAFAQVQRQSWRLSNNGHQGSVEEGAEICTKRRLELERSTACPHSKRLLRGSTAVVGSCCRGGDRSSLPVTAWVGSAKPIVLLTVLGFWPLSSAYAPIGDWDEEIRSERSSCHRVSGRVAITEKTNAL